MRIATVFETAKLLSDFEFSPPPQIKQDYVTAQNIPNAFANLILHTFSILSSIIFGF